MARTSTNISLRGDREYVNALAVLAKREGTSIGVLVRRALDEKYGESLQSISALFFADAETKMSQMEQSRTDEGDNHAH
jgi:hypothetical protein